MAENQINIQQSKRRKMVTVVTLTKSESENTDSTTTGTQPGPVTTLNTNGQRKIYVISTGQVSGAIRTPIILPSGRQRQEYSQVAPQSLQTPTPVPANMIKMRERLQFLSPQKPDSDLQPKSTSPTDSSSTTFQSRKHEILDNAIQEMIERLNTKFKSNQSDSSVSFMPEEKEEDKNVIVRSRMPEVEELGPPLFLTQIGEHEVNIALPLSAIRLFEYISPWIGNAFYTKTEDAIPTDSGLITLVFLKIGTSRNIRVHPHPNRKFRVLKYNKEDVQLCSKGEVFLQRENNLDLYSKSVKKKSSGGAGSGSGAGERMNVLFQKRGVQQKEYSAEEQPLLFTVGKGKSARRYRGVKEGTLIGSKYFIFTHRSDGGFDAYPVNEWYTVKQRINYNNLNYEEAERGFSARHKVLNYFNIMKNAKQKEADQSVNIDKATVKSDLVLSEFDEWKAYDQSDDEMELEDEGSDINQIRAQKRLEEKKRRRAAIVASKRRSKITLSRRKHKSNLIDGFDDEKEGENFEMAGEDSDIDDHEGDELDYLTDSTSDEDKLSEDEREKIYEIPGVDEEVKIISESDEEEEEDELENDGKNDKEEVKDAESQQQKQKVASEIFFGEQGKSRKTFLPSSSCSSDIEEDSDKESNEESSESSESSQSLKSFASKQKRSLEGPSSQSLPLTKRFKPNEIPPPPSVQVPRGRLFDTVRKYLLRKPITLEELMRKLKAKDLLGSDDALNASRVRGVLQVLKPLKQSIYGKAQYYLKY